MVTRTPIDKHIKIRSDTIVPRDKRKKSYQGRSYIMIDGHRYYYISTYGHAGAAEDVALKEYPGHDYAIIPYGGWGNPATPGLFVADTK